MSYVRSASLPHRTVTAADAAPADETKPTQEVIETVGQTTLALYLALSGVGGAASCTVTPYWWDSETCRWYRDGQQSFSLADVGKALFEVRVKGKFCRFIASALVGTNLEIRYGNGFGL